MAAAKIKSNSHTGNLLRSRSEGTLIDIDENVTINNNNLHGNYALSLCPTIVFLKHLSIRIHFKRLYLLYTYTMQYDIIRLIILTSLCTRILLFSSSCSLTCSFVLS